MIRIPVNNMNGKDCKKAVAEVLQAQRFNNFKVEDGFIELFDNENPHRISHLGTSLLKLGYELVYDHQMILVQRISHVVTDMVNNWENRPNLKVSVYLSEKLNLNYNYLSNIFSEYNKVSLRQFIINKRIAADKARSLAPWIIGLVLFGGKDPETGLIVGSAFLKGFSTFQHIKAWEKVGAVPLSRKCLQSPKVRRPIGDGNDDQQALVGLIVEHNVIACNTLSLEGYNGDVMKITLKPVVHPSVLTVPHSQERIELLSQAKTHGNIFAGGR